PLGWDGDTCRKHPSAIAPERHLPLARSRLRPNEPLQHLGLVRRERGVRHRFPIALSVICPRCGAEGIPEGAPGCPKCGVTLGDEQNRTNAAPDETIPE